MTGLLADEVMPSEADALMPSDLDERLPSEISETPQPDFSQLRTSPSANQPSMFSGGMGNTVPSTDNPDYAALAEFARNHPEFVRNAPGHLVVLAQEKVIEPLGQAALTAAGALINPKNAPRNLEESPIQPGKPIIEGTPLDFSPGPDERGVGPAVRRFAAGMTTPGNIVMLPAAPESKAVQSIFLAGAASAIPEQIQKVADAQTPAERRDAATELGLNVAMAELMRRGLKKESEARSQNSEGQAPKDEAAPVFTPEALKDLEATLRGNQLKPEPEARSQKAEGGPIGPKPVTEVRAGDGQVDPIETAIARLKQEGDFVPPVEPEATKATEESGPIGPQTKNTGITDNDIPPVLTEPAARETKAADAPAETAAPAETGVAFTGQNERKGSDATGATSLASEQMPAEGAALESAQPKTAETPPQTARPPSSPKKSFFLRGRSDGVPDILDSIQELGGIRPPGRYSGGEYDGFREAMAGQARLLVRKNAAHAPDTILAELRAIGAPGAEKLHTPDDLYRAIRGAVQGREALRGQARAQSEQAKQVSEFQRRAVNGYRLIKDKSNPIRVPVGKMLEGDTFEVQKHKFEVKHLEFDENGNLISLEVKDGPKFGVQRVDADEFIHVDKGSYEPGAEHDGRVPPELGPVAAGEDPGVFDRTMKYLESLKVDTDGKIYAFGLPAAMWNALLDSVGLALRGGKQIADAVQWAIDRLYDEHPEVKFDEAGARQYLNKTPKGNWRYEDPEGSQQESTIQQPSPERGGEAPAVQGDEARPERERSVDQVKSEFAQADSEMKAAIRRSTSAVNREGMTREQARQATALATAKYRNLREELLHHPDYVAEQLKRQNDAVTEANELLKPVDATVRPDDFLDPAKLEQLDPQTAQRVRELQGVIDQTQREINQMPKKMVARVFDEMQRDGRLPRMKEMEQSDAGRTLAAMTEFLRANDFDSPRESFLSRLAIGKRFAEKIKDAATKTWAIAVATRKAVVQSFKHPPIDDDFRRVLKHWIAYDQRTSLENFRWVKTLMDKVPSATRRKAMSVWLDAGGDRGLLEAQRQSLPYDLLNNYPKIWETALNLTPDEQRIALQVKEDFANKLQDAINTGLVKRGREGYGVPQRWKKPPQTAPASDPFGERRRGTPGNPHAKLDPRDPFFSFQRTTPTYFDGIMGGGVPENLDVAHLVSVYDEAFHKSLSSRGAIAALTQAVAADGRPVVKISGSASTASSPEGGKAYFVDSKARAPGDVSADGRPYRSVDHFALKDWKVAFKDEAGNPIIVKGDMLIHPDHYEFLKNELENPQWTQKGVGKAGLRASAFLKSSKFIGPFHVVTEALHASFHGVVPSVHNFEIDLSQPDQALLSRNMTLGFGHAREMFEEGVSSQHGGIWSIVPGLGDAVVKMNHFTFNEYIPRLKMKVGLNVLERNRERYAGKLTDEQIAELTGRQMDAAFGGQNWRLLGANKSTLAALRLGLVAPDFLISRAKVIGQAFKPYNREQRIFLLAQAAGVWTLCRVANMLFSDDHDPHMEFKNWDSVVIGKRAYHARFIVSDAANLARDLLGLSDFEQRGIPFITGRLGVLPKIAMESLSGKDLFTGQNKDGLFDAHNPVLKWFSIVAKDTAEWMTPMALDGFIGGNARGQTGLEQVGAATFGVTSRKDSPQSEIFKLAREFNEHGDARAQTWQKERDADAGKESAYRKLDNLLDAGDLKAAAAEYERLVKEQGKSDRAFSAHYRVLTQQGKPAHMFTGQRDREQAFFKTLTPQQQRLYRQALTERAERAQAFGKMLQYRRSAQPTPATVSR